MTALRDASSFSFGKWTTASWRLATGMAGGPRQAAASVDVVAVEAVVAVVARLAGIAGGAGAVAGAGELVAEA